MTKNTAKTSGKPPLSSCPPFFANPLYVTPIVIENVVPEIDGGLFCAKGIAGEPFLVEADIFKDGHDLLKAVLKYRKKDETSWQETWMESLGNDRWQGRFIPKENARYLYTIEAWVDPVATWVQEMEKKCPVYPHVLPEVGEMVKFLEVIQSQATDQDLPVIDRLRRTFILSDGASDEVLRIIHSEDFENITCRYLIKEKTSRYDKELELMADRKAAEYAAWYEMFPRSQAKNNRHGTFKDCIRRLSDIKKMGFDVIYLPPIHPIGTTHRKGRNNSLTASRDDPGSPWAIGNKEGGHKSIHPQLGTLDDFRKFVKAAREYDIEIALDFAIQCSPDHPYVKEHPEWFYHLPDGMIRHAENPPKKYEDIYPLDFFCKDYPRLWEELKSILLFWIKQGIRTFRVDNPHTKPLRFWKWIIDEIQRDYPEVIFLSEAFTRPKVMKFLAKAGFTQSYTYFTWRNTKWEIRQYLEELTQTEMKYYFRGNLFTNTPDILTEILQKGGRPAFKMRLVLAATLSSVYGIYSGYELCENTPLCEGSEEYLNSEKYEIRSRDWDQPGNIKDFIARINWIRRENQALQQYHNLMFFNSHNENILCYGKKTADNSNIIIVVVNLDPFYPQEDLVHLPIWEWGIEDWQTYQMKDLITGERYYWKGPSNYVRLDPNIQPAHIFKLTR